MKNLLKDELKGVEEELKNKIRETAETIEAIKNNGVDALVVTTENGEKVLTIQGAENVYKEILNSINSAAITFTEDGTILYSNKSFNEILQLDLHRSVVGMSIYNFISPPFIKKVESLLLEPNAKILSEIELVRNDGIIFKAELFHKPISLDGIPPFMLMMFNIPHSSPLKEKSGFEIISGDIIDSISQAIIVCNLNGEILRYNRSAVILAGQSFLEKEIDSVFNLTDAFGNKISFINYIPDSVLPSDYFIFNRFDDRKFYLSLEKEPLNDTNGIIFGFVITLTDITNHVLTESKAIASLKEKTMLLKEIHHRIKNNLQIVASIINIQSQYIKDEEAKKIFTELKARIKSISLIHEKLYESESISEVRMDRYIIELVKYIKASYELVDKEIQFSFEIDPVFIHPDKVISIGLIITELITNCIKYAFLEKNGNIWISLKKESDNAILIVRDDGIGLPETLKIGETDTLGFLLIKNIADQLDACIVLNRENGTEVKLTFPLK